MNFETQSDLQWILSRYLHKVGDRKMILPSKPAPLSDFRKLNAIACEPRDISDFIQSSRTPYHIPQDETFVLKIPNGKFIDDTSLIIDEKHGYIFRHQALDCVYACTEWKAQQNNLQIKKNIHLPGNVLLLNSTWGSEYAHFFFNVLGKFNNFLSFPLFLDEIDHIVMPEMRPYIAEWIEILGLPKHKIVHIPCGGNNGHPGTMVSSDNLFVPSSPHIVDRNTVAFARNKALINAPRKPATRLLYTSRIKNMNARGRHILNEDEFYPEILKPLGFEYIIEEDLSVQEKALLFHEAKFVISPHSSGATHLSYLQAGSTAVEIIGGHFVDFISEDMARAAGANYYYHITDQIEGLNIRINIENMKKIVNDLRHLIN
jgi:capsular polysaccharide biosynthesis protein